MADDAPTDKARIPYTDSELIESGIFEFVKAGFTYPESVGFAGLDRDRFERNMNDYEVRCHIVDCSMTLTAYRGRHRRRFLQALTNNDRLRVASMGEIHALSDNRLPCLAGRV